MKPLSLAALLLLCATLASARADVRLPALFSNHLVLQRGAPVPVWGTAAAGEEVTVEFAGQQKSATAEASGKWQVKLDALEASAEPRVLTVRGKNALTVSDVLVGEVWLASGQSNMGFSLGGAHNAATEIPKAEDAQLRFFNVKTQTAAEPQTDVHGEWKPSTPLSAPGFSAVAYFFARELRARLRCPVGVVQSAWGGTPAQAWVSLAGLRAEPPLARHLETWEKAVAQRRELEAHPETAAAYLEQLKRWNAEVRPGYDAATKAYNAAKAAGQEAGPKPAPSWPEPANPDPMGIPSPSSRPSTPSVIFNGMIAPLAPFALRGVIWYQGEANGGAGLDYRTLFPRLIQDWRQHWGAEFPFLFVQLPGWDHDPKAPPFHDWPWLREAQLLTLETVPRTGMAVAIDVGDPGNVHPGDKLDVGLRLARVARQVAYGEKIVASGPLYRGFAIEGSAIRVSFEEPVGGLVIGEAPWRANGVEPLPADKLLGFTIAGEDRHWAEAEARIDGDSVVVSSTQVPHPVAVRYGWANSPRVNLYNRDALPASPFRTDDWPMPTATR